MENWILILCVIAVYCIVVLGIGILSRNKGGASSLEEYVVGGRSLKPFVAYFTYVATFHSSFAFLGAAGQMYTSGISFFATFTSCVVSPLMIYFIGRPVWYLGKKYHFMTQADLLSDYYQSRFLRILVAAVNLIFLVPYLQSQISGGGIIFSAVTGDRISYTAGTLILYAVIIGYILLGGFKAVAWTDTFQGILMIVLIWVAGGTILGAVTGTLDWSVLMNRVATELPERVLIPVEYWPVYMTSFLSLFGISILSALLPALLCGGESQDPQVAGRHLPHLPDFLLSPGDDGGLCRRADHAWPGTGGYGASLHAGPVRPPAAHRSGNGWRPGGNHVLG